MEEDYSYILRVPTASTIYPRATVEESISGLDDVNRFLPTDKSFPEEIRLLINEQVRTNPTYEKIHSTWTSLTHRHDFVGGIPKEGVKYDKIKKSFYVSPNFFLTLEERQEGTKIILDTVASAADTLYRLRCYFPDIYTRPRDGYKCIWLAGVRHNQTGLVLMLTEHKANVSVNVVENGRSIDFAQAETEFTTDAVELLNMLFKTVEGSRRFAYYESPITSVWQVKLQHKVKGAFILFMDDRGLFDIRVNGEDEAKEVMNDIVGLVNALCSDECCHPYDGVVAGCAA
ncbi:hypothetical protein Clacol_000075 [Clathrus columnatus]|uniref:Uncharacterized protein n=1 Tax=Clathrus columnatus TaxID=1419009 RepID=A0AAV4ZYF8_9AGAM|nr:hypothetical protein Clacol_000075 [Clathrus columnatus]